MHSSSLENMEKCFRRYVAERVASREQRKYRVLDIGGADVNGSYADLFPKEHFEYVGADLKAGPGVSIVLEDPYRLPVSDGSFDYVLSGQMLEHCEFFWKSFEEMVRVLAPNGLIFLIAPSAGPIHLYPVDCYRFYPDAYRALATHAGCHLVDWWHDQRGPWNDLVGVFSREPREANRSAASSHANASRANSFSAEQSLPSSDLVQGTVHYLDLLRRLHTVLRPAHYFEIGVRKGQSLSLATCPAIGVDPEPEIAVALGENVRVVADTSDDFFENESSAVLPQSLELVFIDGMHLFEFVLRDFMNVERRSGDNTVVVIDDMLPNLPEQASRERKTRVWTGDVWKMHECLRKYRPDLRLTLLDTSPTGLLLVTGLNPRNQTLWQRYNPIVREYAWTESAPPKEVLERQGVVPASGAQFESALSLLEEARTAERAVMSIAPRFHERLRASARRPKLSLVVIAYNMARELPRTLQTLSPAMQRDLSVDDYEIIVVDNGSSAPFDADACAAISPNIRIVHHDPAGSVSPVAAIAKGLECAQGELVGVFIDGARMASPGLLSTAMQASALSPRAIIGTIAFHLGSETQMKSVHKGYNQEVEDRLLSTVPWQSDGDRLFEISVFAGSSGRGWFTLPSETNALFLRKEQWKALGGYEQRFQSSGGGLANLDMWKRACEQPGAEVILLAGEATFHQFHGGIATNSLKPPQQDFHAEYQAIRGEAFVRPTVPFRIFGSFRDVHRESIKCSK